MITLRSFINWLRTMSASNRAALKARASSALSDLRQAHGKIAAEAKTLDRQFASELRYKSALARIDARLLDLTNRLLVAEMAGDRASAEALAAAATQWEARRKSCEAELNLVRRRINTTRHGWAKLEKDARQIGAWLRQSLAGARPVWADAVRRMGEKLMAGMAAERARIAAMMTKSALLHDGRDLSAPLAQLRRFNVARQRIGVDDLRYLLTGNPCAANPRRS
ncbi:hypothetical protein [Parvibaculum sp.]|uniref:hypothetical protein n=1 Tax=Parvibaculum sp. TaxID=2024848 RepID=UPI0034A09075